MRESFRFNGDQVSALPALKNAANREVEWVSTPHEQTFHRRMQAHLNEMGYDDDLLDKCGIFTPFITAQVLHKYLKCEGAASWAITEVRHCRSVLLAHCF